MSTRLFDNFPSIIMASSMPDTLLFDWWKDVGSHLDDRLLTESVEWATIHNWYQGYLSSSENRNHNKSQVVSLLRDYLPILERHYMDRLREMGKNSEYSTSVKYSE